MENASKALLMAAGVLVGVLIISLATYLFIDFGTTSAEINKRNEERQLNEFNATYTKYADRKDLTLYDIISIANNAKDNNKFYAEYSSFASLYEIKVSILGKGSSYLDLQNKSDEACNYLIQEEQRILANQTHLPIYSCNEIKPTHYHNNGRIRVMTFSQNS